MAAPVKSRTRKNSTGSEVVLVANYHTGGIVFPRTGANGLMMPPLRLAPGSTTPVEKEEWDKRKKMTVVQHYLDAGILGIVQKTGAVPVQGNTTTTLVVPEHLAGEDHEGKEEGVKAKTRRKKVGSVTVK
jgi:hypothetical protein